MPGHIWRNLNRANAPVSLVQRFLLLRDIEGFDNLLLVHVNKRIFGISDIKVLRKHGDFLSHAVKELTVEKPAI